MIKLADEKLTVKQKRFCDYYNQNPNATEAAIKAGYSKNTASEIGCENLKKPKIQETIKKVHDSLASDRIASIDEIKTFWTTTMYKQKADLKDRLKASELLARSGGAFVDRVEVVDSIDINIKTVSPSED